MKESVGYEHPFHGISHGEFTWCLHCEAASRTVYWVENDWDCPAKGCHGSALDAFSWDKDNWPRSVHPEYPEIPDEAAYYPLYLFYEAD